MWAALDRRTTDDAFRVIPVLLPRTALPTRPNPPRFLANLAWVQFNCDTSEEQPLHQLIAAIVSARRLSETTSDSLPQKTPFAPHTRREFSFRFWTRGQTYLRAVAESYRTYSPRELAVFMRAAPDLEKLYVPLLLVSEIPQQARTMVVGGRRSGAARSIWTFIAESRSTPAYRRIVILGPPGSGKTTLLEHLASILARGTLGEHGTRTRHLVPILLAFRTAKSTLLSRPDIGLADLAIELLLPDLPALRHSRNWLERKLRAGRCLILLDGLDEVADEAERIQVSRWVDRQINAHPRNTFILTSRPLGYRAATLERAGLNLALEPFNLEQATDFLIRWYSQARLLTLPGEPTEIFDRAQLEARALADRIGASIPLSEMASNPLLLTLMAIVHMERGALPEKRGLLFQAICDVLLRDRPMAKGIAIADPCDGLDHQIALECIAFQLMLDQNV